jgi:predicted transcriptional regulator
MRALLDTNTLIHREAPVVVEQDIGLLFNWLDRLGYEKCVHPVSLDEIRRHKDARVRRSFSVKLASYKTIQIPAPLAPDVQALSEELDLSENDKNDTKIVNELYADRVDLIISEDRGLARKAGSRRSRFARRVDVVVVYVTAPVRRVVGEFDVLSIINESVFSLWEQTKQFSGVEEDFFFRYFQGRERGFAIEVGEVRPYQSPYCPIEHLNVRPPQSFVYLDSAVES